MCYSISKTSCKEGYQITLILSAAIMAAGTLGCLVASEPLMRLFTSTPETVEAGKVALRIICLGFVVSAIVSLIVYKKSV